MKTSKITFLGVLVLSLTACQNTAKPEGGASLESALKPVSKPEVAATPKAETKKAEPDASSIEKNDERVSYIPPPVGTKMVWKNSKGKLFPFTITSHTFEYNGQQVTKSSSSRGVLYRKKSNGNAIARVSKAGRITALFKPHTGFLNFPLYVGKKWSHSYSYEYKPRPFTQNKSFSAEVMGWENLKTAFGTVRTLRIKRKWGIAGGTTTTWYAPKLGTIIKNVNTSRLRQESGEVVSYKLP